MVVNRITTMGQRAGGGAGGRNAVVGGKASIFGTQAFKDRFDRHTTALYEAIKSGNNSAISKAKAVVKKDISQMHTVVVKASAANSSDAAFYSSKQNNSKSQYNPTQYKYNKTLAQLYGSEAAKRK